MALFNEPAITGPATCTAALATKILYCDDFICTDLKVQAIILLHALVDDSRGAAKIDLSAHGSSPGTVA